MAATRIIKQQVPPAGVTAHSGFAYYHFCYHVVIPHLSPIFFRHNSSRIRSRSCTQCQNDVDRDKKLRKISEQCCGNRRNLDAVTYFDKLSFKPILDFAVILLLGDPGCLFPINRRLRSTPPILNLPGENEGKSSRVARREQTIDSSCDHGLHSTILF